jgi:hypothetical protein
VLKRIWLIEEALIYDDRILEVTDIDVEQVMTLFTENLKYIVMKELINITPKLSRGMLIL